MHERSPYLRLYRDLLSTQYDPPEVLRRRQWVKLCRLLEHAYKNVDFWRQRFSDCGLDPREVGSYDALRRLPILTKSEIRRHGDRMLARGYDRSNLRRSATSGSTGVSLEVFADEAAMQFKRACTLRSDEWSGWRLGERIAMVWGNPQYPKRGWRGRVRNALLDREVYLDTLKMDADTIDRFLGILERKRPSLLFGHAHSLYLLARFAEQRRRTDYRPRAIISSAMVLSDRERDCIERVFRCAVTNRYGCEEVGLIACECERHQGMHLNADGLFVEIVGADGEPADPGQVGAIVITDLANCAMPLIRYQVGDMGTWSERTCECGRTLPLLEKIEGRVADYVITPTAELVSGISLTENFAMLVPGIEQLQIIQESIDLFTFRIVRGGDFTEASETRIRTLVRERFGRSVNYRCEYVDSIPQERSGKYRFCISHVENPFTTLGHQGSAMSKSPVESYNK